MPSTTSTSSSSAESARASRASPSSWTASLARAAHGLSGLGRWKTWEAGASPALTSRCADRLLELRLRAGRYFLPRFAALPALAPACARFVEATRTGRAGLDVRALPALAAGEVFAGACDRTGGAFALAGAGAGFSFSALAAATLAGALGALASLPFLPTLAFDG